MFKLHGLASKAHTNGLDLIFPTCSLQALYLPPGSTPPNPAFHAFQSVLASSSKAKFIFSPIWELSSTPGHTFVKAFSNRHSLYLLIGDASLHSRNSTAGLLKVDNFAYFLASKTKAKEAGKQ